MAGGGFFNGKLKRKDIDRVQDDFSDFSLSSPATKIRRLDAELPPIIEEEEVETPAVLEQQVPEAPVIEELPFVPENEERAIVLFKPVNTPHLLSHPNLSVSVDPHIISRFKNQFIQLGHPDHVKSADEETALSNKKNLATSGCLAVVPWVPSQLPSTSGMDILQPEGQHAEAPEPMEAEEMEMDIEDNNDVSTEEGNTYEFGILKASEGFHQWPQQHCMVPQPPQNTSTAITWLQ